jgi:hypothetical protein
MLKVDAEFKALIPALSKEDFEQLEKNILEFGMQDAICTWENTIIDGHNRFEIACKYKIRYKISEFVFNNRNEVICWMIDNQMGRRNLSDFVKYELKDKKVGILKIKGREKMITSSGGVNPQPLSITDKPCEPKHNTQKIIAQELNWSTGKVAQAKKVKDKAPIEVKEKLRNNEITINQAYQQVRRIEKVEAIEEKISTKIKPDNIFLLFIIFLLMFTMISHSQYLIN